MKDCYLGNSKQSGNTCTINTFLAGNNELYKQNNHKLSSSCWGIWSIFHMSFLHWVSEFSLSVRHSESLEQSCCFFASKRVSRGGGIMPPGHLPLGDFLGMTNWEETPGRPRTHLRDCISYLAREHLGMPQEELESITQEKEVKNTPLSLQPLWPHPGYEVENGWMSSDFPVIVQKYRTTDSWSEQ